MGGSDLNHRITVRRGVRGQVSADVAAGAGAIVHDHLLTVDRAEAFGDNAGQRIGAAAASIGYHIAHDLSRVGLRMAVRYGESNCTV